MRVTRGVAVGLFGGAVALAVGGLVSRQHTAPTSVAVATADASPGSFHVTGDYDGPSHFTVGTERCEMIDTVWDATVSVSNGETWRYHNEYCGTLVDGLFSGAGAFSFTVPDGDRLFGTRRVTNAPIPGTGGTNQLRLTGGTGQYAGATGSCVMHNHHEESDNGAQRQWGSLECDITAPNRASSPVAGVRHVDGSYDGISDFALGTERCATVDTVWNATFAVSNGETWQYRNDYCGTVVDGVFNGDGTFSFTAANGDTVVGTSATIDIPVPPPSGTGGPTYLTINGGTGEYADATGACVLDNRVQNYFEGRFGHQRQWGTFECDVIAPSFAAPTTESTTTTSTSTTTSAPTTPTSTTTAPPPMETTPTVTFGSWTGREPAVIYFSGDAGNVAYDLTWTTWNDQSAVGRGTRNELSCEPSCATGTSTPYPVTITLSDPTDGQFTAATEVTNDGHGTTETFTSPTWAAGACTTWDPTSTDTCKF